MPRILLFQKQFLTLYEDIRSVRKFSPVSLKSTSLIQRRFRPHTSLLLFWGGMERGEGEGTDCFVLVASRQHPYLFFLLGAFSLFSTVLSPSFFPKLIFRHIIFEYFNTTSLVVSRQARFNYNVRGAFECSSWYSIFIRIPATLTKGSPTSAPLLRPPEAWRNEKYVSQIFPLRSSTWHFWYGCSKKSKAVFIVAGREKTRLQP